VKKDEIVFWYEYGLELYFEPIKVGDESILIKKGFRLLHPDEKRYLVILDDGRVLTFKAYEEDKYRVTAIGDRYGNHLDLMFNERKEISYIATQDNRLFELKYETLVQEEKIEKQERKAKKLSNMYDV